MNTLATLALQHFLIKELTEVRRRRKAVIKYSHPEDVHQLRVSLRRSRSILKLCSPILKSTYLHHWQRRLRKLSKQLDAARDLDVFIQKHLNELDADASLKNTLQRKRERIYKNMEARLRHGSFKPWRRQFQKQLMQHDWTQRHCRHHKLTLKHLARHRLKIIHSAIEQEVKQLDLDNDQGLHQLRILFKQLRYSCEFLTPVLNKNRNLTFLENIEYIQDQLGNLHDLSIQHTRFADIPFASEFDIDADNRLRQEIQTTLVAFIGLEKPWRSI